MTTDRRGPGRRRAADRRHDLRVLRGRIEKKLNRLDGVTATVNYATEKAKVSFADGVTTDDLIATVEKTGYTAALPAAAAADDAEPAERTPRGRCARGCWSPPR